MVAASVINTREMKYTGVGIAALKSGNLHPFTDVNTPNGNISDNALFSNRVWSQRQRDAHPPRFTDALRHNIGNYPLTSELASWVAEALVKYQPTDEVLELVRPFASKFHAHLEKERANSTGFHDLNLVELAYQVSLEVGGALLLAASANGDPVDLQVEFHSSRAARDDHFAPWGKLLTGLECDPPIIAQFPFYLMMCQSFGLESDSSQEDYVYSALTGVDWARGKNVFSERFATFEKRAIAAVPKLDDRLSGKDRSFWRISLAYLGAMNDCENARKFTTPRKSAINHDLDDNLVMAIRGFDTIGSAYMCSDGAAFLDNAGMDSLIGSALPNDVMDLHTDIKTGETRNLLRLLYPDGLSIDESLQTMSTIFSGMLCELFRGHKRIRFENREDGRIAATSPPYSFCRARHRRIFETLETYTSRYPLFWVWTMEIYRRARAQVTEAGLNELLIDALKRARTREALPDSPSNKFYDIYFDMIDNGTAQMQEKKPLGVDEKVAQVIRDLHSLWHDQLLAENKEPGWGRKFDNKSDALLGEAGNILGEKGDISKEVYRFAIAYGRLSMGLPYIAYHTVDAIIMTFGIDM
ncbi:uncharacterized protein TRUGW13939_11833 [Talaromyces rugulosus]|uniref:Uncharacterized protein n=1 Tax=Talaromyces rugulosus TaxID=121627 RepID=A0A7H8REW3_TALRU|nr:uncharacterized protein TRUGW13939_11833 [Talaromyces rugulosus]QKX64657.1 hypothetical protein TRUGW13939_11833 [Talaromyces rugulosus]